MEVHNLQIAPNGVSPIIHVSQYDEGRQFQLKLYDGATAYSVPSGATAKIHGVKPDEKGFIYDDAVSISGNTVTVTTKQQMTVVEGIVECEIRFTKNGLDIGTLNFKMMVEKSPINEDTDVSETVLPDIIDAATRHMNAAAASATLSESFARGGTGTRTGENTDNANYYRQQAADSASSAANSEQQASAHAIDTHIDALSSEGYAVGTQEGQAVTSESPYFENNAKWYSDRAAAYSLHVPYIGANGNWWIWNVTQGAYIDSGVDASITVDIADITMLAPDATPYVTNTGTATDPIFHLFIPRGKGISSITKTSTSGLVDTYTITFSDGATTTYTVTNGKTAYQSAVEGGYSDSEAKFENDLANFGAWASNTQTNKEIARQAAIDATNQANRAEQYANFLEPHFVIQNNRLYIKDDAIGEFIVANNRLYMKIVA